MPSLDTTFSSQGHTLAATLTRPDRPGPYPGAVLISGSGPFDRNTNMKRRRLEIMRHLAEHLAEAGIATLRYDKRGAGASDGDYHATGFHDNVTDAAAAVEKLRGRPDISGIFVVGHSEGALIATRLAASGIDADGVVLLAGSARSGADTLRYQADVASDALPGLARLIMRLLRTDIHKVQAKRLAQLEATTTDTTRIQMAKVNAKWFREFMVYDPTEDFSSISTPVLAITGEKDLQVPASDLDVMRTEVGGPIEVHRPEHLTHLLRNDPNHPNLKDYRRQLGQPTDSEVMELVAGWISGVTAGRSDRTSNHSPRPSTHRPVT